MLSNEELIGIYETEYNRWMTDNPFSAREFSEASAHKAALIAVARAVRSEDGYEHMAKDTEWKANSDARRSARWRHRPAVTSLANESQS